MKKILFKGAGSAIPTPFDEKGVNVDIEVKLNDEYFKNPSDEADNQLNTAINYLIENK